VLVGWAVVAHTRQYRRTSVSLSLRAGGDAEWLAGDGQRARIGTRRGGLVDGSGSLGGDGGTDGSSRLGVRLGRVVVKRSRWLAVVAVVVMADGSSVVGGGPVVVTERTDAQYLTLLLAWADGWSASTVDVCLAGEEEKARRGEHVHAGPQRPTTHTRPPRGKKREEEGCVERR